MSEQPASLDHRMRDEVLVPLHERLSKASQFSNSLGMGEFSVNFDRAAGVLSIMPTDLDATVTVSYRVVPSPVVYVSIYYNQKTIAKLTCLTHEGMLIASTSSLPMQWPGKFVTVDRLWNVMLVCGLGALRGLRGANPEVCDQCQHQFACLARNEVLPGLKKTRTKPKREDAKLTMSEVLKLLELYDDTKKDL